MVAVLVKKCSGPYLKSLKSCLELVSALKVFGAIFEVSKIKCSFEFNICMKGVPYWF